MLKEQKTRRSENLPSQFSLILSLNPVPHSARTGSSF
jgi:hypothetical protein